MAVNGLEREWCFWRSSFKWCSVLEFSSENVKKDSKHSRFSMIVISSWLKALQSRRFTEGDAAVTHAEGWTLWGDKNTKSKVCVFVFLCLSPLFISTWCLSCFCSHSPTLSHTHEHAHPSWCCRRLSVVLIMNMIHPWRKKLGCCTVWPHLLRDSRANMAAAHALDMLTLLCLF